MGPHLQIGRSVPIAEIKDIEGHRSLPTNIANADVVGEYPSHHTNTAPSPPPLLAPPPTTINDNTPLPTAAHQTKLPTLPAYSI